MPKINLDELYHSVVLFNALAGNLSDVSPEKLLAQARCVAEEGNELLQALEQNEGQAQILKETIDVFVTAFGMLILLQLQGYNVQEAFEAVNKNNLSKVTLDAATAAYTAAFYNNSKPYIKHEVHVVDNNYHVKNEAGKVVKPINYVPVDVSQFVPQKLEE